MSKAAELIRQIQPEAIREKRETHGLEVWLIAANSLRAVCDLLKRAADFDQLLDVIGIDWLGKKTPRFEVDYLFYSINKKTRLQLKVTVPDDTRPQLDSIHDIFSPANWAEREVFDMFGIHFTGHPKLERLLMWDDFIGHPLRKDYALDKRQPIPVAKDLL